MKGTNRTMGASMRWTHLLTASPLLAFTCAAAHENEALVFFVQAGLLPALVLTGGMMCRQARPGCLISTTRRAHRHGTASEPG